MDFFLSWAETHVHPWLEGREEVDGKALKAGELVVFETMLVCWLFGGCWRVEKHLQLWFTVVKVMQNKVNICQALSQVISYL